MVNYQNGKIYKIIAGDLIYVGSTVKQLSNRMSAHRTNYKRHKEGKSRNVTSFILFDKFGVENCKIILLELFPCNSKEELLAKEQEYIDKLDCVNKYKAYVPAEEKKKYTTEWQRRYRDNNKEQIRENKKQYRVANKEKIYARDGQVCQCVCGKSYTHGHKLRHEKTQFHVKFLENK